MAYLTLNLVNYSVLHIDIGLILVGMITNISNCKNTVFLPNNNDYLLKYSFWTLKWGLLYHLNLLLLKKFWDFQSWMWDSLEKFSRKFSSTVGLLFSDCGTFAKNFLENFSWPCCVCSSWLSAGYSGIGISIKSRNQMQKTLLFFSQILSYFLAGW